MYNKTFGCMLLATTILCGTRATDHSSHWHIYWTHDGHFVFSLTKFLLRCLRIYVVIANVVQGFEALALHRSFLGVIFTAFS